MSEELPKNIESGNESGESIKPREIKLTYKSLFLDLYYEFINIATSLNLYDFPKSDFEIVQDNRELAERVSDDEDNEEKDMGNVTLTFRFKANDEDFVKIKKVIDEEFDPLIYAYQQETVDKLLENLKKEE